MTVRFGTIGVGVIAEYHRQAIEAVDDAELVGVYDRFQEPLERFSQKHNIPHFDSVESLVRDGKCDVITIATPSGWHLQPAVEAMRAGAHILCEKPLEVTLQRIDRMIETANETKRKLGAVLQIRTFPSCVKAKQVITQGKLGKIVVADAYIKYFRTQEYYEESAWRGTWDLDGGGATMNQGIHWIDLLNWLVGDAEWVLAAASTLAHTIEVEDVCHAVIGWKNGAQGVIEATTCAKPGFESRIEIHGEKGSILLEDTRIKKLIIEGEEDYEEAPKTAAGGHADPKVFSVEGHILHVRDMMQAIAEDREPVIPGAEARKSVQLITTMYESSRIGRRINLDS